MGKILGGFLRFLFVLFIVALVGYNTMQVAALRAEVERLKRQGDSAADVGKAGAGDADPAAVGGSFLARARSHAERARESLRKKQYTDAQRELAAAAEALEKASQSVGAGTRDTLAGLRETLRTLSRQAETLWERQGGTESEKRP